MKATGLFFLRMRASVVSDAAGERVGVRLPVVERAQDDGGRWVVINTLLAKWKGPAALAFFDAHQAELIPGRGLELELDRLRGTDGEWVAHVATCALAPLPPSWRTRDATQNPQPGHETATT
jgi:hypothetical protein